MENASKALIIAGSALLVMLILTFAVTMFTTIGNQTKNFYDKMDQSYIDSCNQQFLNFHNIDDENKDDITIQDVISIINLAKDNNTNGKIPRAIKVFFLGKEVQDFTEEQKNNLLLKYIGNDYKFKCEVVMDEGFVEKVDIRV